MSKQDYAIIVDNLHKTFKLPHEKHSTLKQAALNAFKKKSYERFVALEGVSFKVKKGEFFGIVGRNGSGKSTLLKTIAGIYHPNEGGVLVNGRLTPFIELGVGFNPELTGRDNVFLNGAILGLDHQEISEKYKEIVAFAELERFMDQRLKNYSSGMQVRLAFAIAIQAHNDILLIDEVLAVGDTNFQQKGFEVFRELKKQNKTIVFVSHDLNSIEEFCDRVAVINNSKLTAIGETVKTINSYRTIMAESEAPQAPDAPQRAGTGDVLLKKVEVLSEGKQTKAINENSPFSIKMHYVAKKQIKKPVFGLAINDKNGCTVVGPNTKEAQIKIDSIKGKGSVTAEFKKNVFSPGKYTVTVSCFDDKLVTALDYVENIQQFRVIGKERYGSVNIEPEWRISQ